MNQIEKVARAMCRADPEVRMGDADGVVEQRVNTEWVHYVDQAKAADRLTAMKAAGDGLEEALGDLLGATEEVGYVHYAPFRAKARSALKQWKEASDGL